MNGHFKPTQKPASKLEITETPMQQLSDIELDAVVGGFKDTFEDLDLSNKKKNQGNPVSQVIDPYDTDNIITS